MKTYDYQLCDDGGVSQSESQEILIPIGTQFLHEFGLYRVDEYRDGKGQITRVTSKITNVWCERIKTNQELNLKK